MDIINRHRLDPLLLMSKDEMLTLMKRHDLPVPAPLAIEAQETYIASLSKVSLLLLKLDSRNLYGTQK